MRQQTFLTQIFNFYSLRPNRIKIRKGQNGRALAFDPRRASVRDGLGHDDRQTVCLATQQTNPKMKANPSFYFLTKPNFSHFYAK
jgi:hypothetical protein